jgi:threonine/homoserine/homoserine lactone efflux protein
MLDSRSFAVFMLATVAMNVSPGPDTLYVLARTLGQGRRAGVVSVLGGSTGRLAHTLLAATGVSAVLAASPAVFAVVRTAGAIYLCVLGISQALSTLRAPDGSETAARANSRLYVEGFVTNLSNPGPMLFFLAFLPQFVVAGGLPAWVQIALLGLVFTASATVWSLIVVAGSGRIRELIVQRPGALRAIRVVSGLLLVAVAVWLWAKSMTPR